MATRPLPRLLRALAASIVLLATAGALTPASALAQDNGQWVLWKGSDQTGGDKMYLFCIQNGVRVVDLTGLKAFSEFLLDGKVNRVRFKDNLDSDDDVGAYREMNVVPQIGTLCQWGMGE